MGGPAEQARWPVALHLQGRQGKRRDVAQRHAVRPSARRSRIPRRTRSWAVVVNIRKAFWRIGLWTRTAGQPPKGKAADTEDREGQQEAPGTDRQALQGGAEAACSGNARVQRSCRFGSLGQQQGQGQVCRLNWHWVLAHSIVSFNLHCGNGVRRRIAGRATASNKRLDIFSRPREVEQVALHKGSFHGRPHDDEMIMGGI